MYRSVLVPLDGSAFGEHALPLALSIARRGGATLHVTHVHVPPAPINIEGVAFPDPSVEREVREKGRAYLEGVVGRLQAAAKVPISTDLLDGIVPEAVHEHAVAVKADLVVLTTHGRGPLSRFWLGSVADQLIRRLPMPMVLVRPQGAAPDFARDVAFHRVLIPLDGSPFAEQILPPATALGTLMKAEHMLVRVVPPLLPGDYELGEVPMVGLPGSRLTQLRGIQEKAQEEATAYLEGVAARLCTQGISMQTRVVCHDSPASAILDAAGQVGADVLALATHGRGGLARLLLGSVADKILRGATTPVLLYRPVHP